ncbi:hypothetical protein NQ317_017325 [Molorchus minor]|uniref:Peptidase M12B propeptide domain-containing protein n=1 Tax=Molorchus minor TaxID=1323400 RepID=A0ABQ9K203_9CUCU|nr:hypothetical protein NQ317_017325 [Molorchus minor]
MWIWWILVIDVYLKEVNLIEKTHLEDLGHTTDVEYVMPLKLDPVLHGHDIIYDLQRNKHDETVLKHHSGHFRHKSAEVWDPHPQYRIRAFGKELVLQLKQDRKFVAPDLHITNIHDNYRERSGTTPRRRSAFFIAAILKGTTNPAWLFLFAMGCQLNHNAVIDEHFVFPTEYCQPLTVCLEIGLVTELIIVQ